LLVRHGETALSGERRFSGRGDPPLTERGERQARAVAERVKGDGVDVVVTSPLQRAHRTAEAIAAAVGADLVVNDDIIETEFGEWEGMTFAEIRERWPDQLQAWSRSPDVAPPGGESFAATFARVGRARDALLSSYAGATVAVVSHVTPIKTLLRDALAAPVDALYRIHLDPASLSVTDWWAGGHAVVRLVNDTSHLGAALATTAR
jgi:probable phosphoglycerate mutase